MASAKRGNRQIRGFRIDQTQWRRAIGRTDVQGADLFGWEQHEPATAGDDTGEIVIGIMVDLRLDPAAEPEIGTNVD